MVVSIETGHKDSVTHLAVDQYNKRAATASIDCTINIYDIKNPDVIQKVGKLSGGHDGPIFQISFSHPLSGRYLASCGVDHRIIIWKYDEENSIQDDQEKWNIDFSHKMESSVNGLQFSPYQYGTKLVAVCSESKILIISKHDFNNGNSDEKWTIQVLEEHVPMGSLAISWAPATAVGSIVEDGNSLKTFQRFAIGGIDQFLRIWHLCEENTTEPKWKLAFELGEHSEWIRCISWCPLFINRNKCQIAVGLHNGQVVVWTYDDITKSWDLDIVYKGGTFVSSLAFSMCGTMLTAAFSNDHSIVLRRNYKNEWMKICHNINN